MRMTTRQSPSVLAVAVLALVSCRGSDRDRSGTAPPEAAAGTAAQRERREQVARRVNAGIALLEQHKFAAAEKEFTEALAADPQDVPARIDLGIALAAQVKYEPALAELARGLVRRPDQPNALYVTGLLQRTRGDTSRARTALARVVAIDPRDPDARYALAQVELADGHAAIAIRHLEAVVREAPYFLSARYALGQAQLREGQRGADAGLTRRGEETIAEFQRLAGGLSVETAGLQYGEQGRYGLAVEADPVPRPQPRAALRFLAAAEAFGIDFESARAEDLPASLGSGVLLADLDGDGLDDLLLAGSADGRTARLWKSLGKGRFEEVTDAAGLGDLRTPGVGVAAGDMDADGRPDLLVGGRLLLQEAPLRFRDATSGSGLDAGLLERAASTSFVDLDHDGDLDLVLTLPDGGGVEVMRNDGGGHLGAGTAASGFASDAPAVAITTADLDEDRDVDVLVSTLDGPPLLYENRRDLTFAPSGATRLPRAPGGGIAAIDLDADRAPEVLLLNLAGGRHGIFRNRRDRTFEPFATLPSRGTAHGAVFFDADLDGDADLAIGDETGLRLFRNAGAQRFVAETEAAPASDLGGDVRGLAAADLDQDGDLDLVANVRGGRAMILENRTARSDSSWIRLELRGRSSNRGGLGTKVELHSGSLRQQQELHGAEGFLSQGPLALTFGLGTSGPASSDGSAGVAPLTVERLRLLWPGGVLQAERDLESGRRHTIEELDRKGSSCPFLWAFDGREMRFVSDVQGGGPLGIWLAPGVRNLPDPDEWMLIPAGLAAVRDGAYDLRLTESLEEIAYIDRALLRVIDAPGDVSPFPNERLLLVPPFATPGLHLVRERRRAVRATDAEGRDVTPALAAIDRSYAGAVRRTRFRGHAEPWSLELDFGTLPAPARRGPVVLLAFGTIEFPNSTPIVAATQAGIAPALPALDLLDAAGRVTSTIEAAGAPAGLPKWMALDLTGRIPPDGRVRLRYRTSLDVSFDAVEIGLGDPGAPHRVTDVEAETADLRFGGYPTLEAPGGPPPRLYLYDPPLREETWADQEGLYTRFGDVRELLAAEDDRLAVLSHGDEIALRFPVAALPPLPRGWARHLVLYTVGYAKDLDRNSAQPDTVGPLPYRAMTSYPYAGPGPLLDPAVRQALATYSRRYVRAP